MYRPVLRAATAATNAAKAPAGRRFASSIASRSGTWKGAALRWGLAGAGIYYYNTASAFAEHPQLAAFAPPETNHESESYPTIDSIAEQRRAQARSLSDASASIAVAETPSPAGLEEEAEQQGAFNEETGEINWDCPCLGGMANGPCGEQFRAAFSCFIFSKEEPKGVDCIEHFKTMQNCFREYPEIYGAELDDDELAAGEAAGSPENAPEGGAPTPSDPEPSKKSESTSKDIDTSGTDQHDRGAAATEQVKQTHGESGLETDALVPRAAHDARS